MDVPDTSSNVSPGSPRNPSTTDFPIVHSYFIKTVASLRTEIFEPFIRQFAENERKALSILESLTPSESELKTYNQMKELVPRLYNEIRETLSDSFQLVTSLENITVNNCNSSVNILNPSYHCFNQNDPSQQQNPNISYHRARTTNNFTNSQKKALLLFTKCGLTKPKAKKIVQAIGEKSNCLQFYKSFWRRWYKWCQENSVHHLDCSSFEFLKFLQQFTQGRQPATVNGCCVAICFVIKHAGGSDLAFKDPMIKAYTKRIMSKPKTVISFQEEPASNAISTHKKANMDQDTSFFHNHPSHGSSLKNYSDPTCKENSPVSTIENRDCSPNNQDLIQKRIEIEECDNIQFHEEASLNALQQENDCSTSILHGEDSSSHLYLSNSSENAIEIGNIEVACNSHFNQPMKQLFLQKEIDENFCSSKNNQNPQNGIFQQQNSNISHRARSANNFTDFQIKALLLFTECGFTEEKAKKVVEAIREKPNSIRWYKCFWRSWYKWCQENSVHHLDCSSFEFLKFLQQFTQGRQPVTVKDCCDAIGRVVMHAGESDLAFKDPMIKAYIKRIMSEPKTIISFQQEPASNVISTNMDQNTGFFHNHPSHGSSLKSYSDPSCKENSADSTIENGDSSPNNQDLIQKVIKIEECDAIPFHEEASLNPLQQENNCSTSILHDEDSSTQPYLSSSSENDLEIENIEVAYNSHFNQPLKQFCFQKEIDENICSSKNDDAFRKSPDQNDSKECNQISTTDNNETSLNNQDLTQKVTKIEECDSIPIHEEALLNPLQHENDCSTSILHDKDSSAQPSLSSYSENSLEIENFDVASNSHFNQPLKQFCFQKEIDENICSSKNDDSLRQFPDQNDSKECNQIPTTDNGETSLNNQDLTQKVIKIEECDSIPIHEEALLNPLQHENDCSTSMLYDGDSSTFSSSVNSLGNKNIEVACNSHNISREIPNKSFSSDFCPDSRIILAQMIETVCCQHDSRTNVVNPSEQVSPKKIKLESYLSSDILNFL